MEVNYRIVPCERSHIDYLAQTMPEIQRREVSVWTEVDPHTVLVWAWEQSLFSWCAIFGDTPAAVYGVTGTMMDSTWGAWMITNDAFRTIQPLSLVRASRRELHRVADGRTLQAMVPDYYPASVRFFEAIGFRRVETVTALGGAACAILRFNESGT